MVSFSYFSEFVDAPYKIFYAAAMFLSAIFYLWLTWRLNRGGSIRQIMFQALAWAAANGFVAGFFDTPIGVTAYFAFQVWLGSFFLVPPLIKRRYPIWKANRTPTAAEKYALSAIKNAKERYRKSAINRAVTDVRNYWDQVSFRKKTLVKIAICLSLLGFFEYWDR
ncbi:MAG TPA: hypothetical protein DCY27_08090 [Desulfobacterales bacterium]|nr:hypothetical protein [Desulfobacterales bacterium]